METTEFNEEYDNLQSKIDKNRKYKKRRVLDYEDGEKTISWLDKTVNIINTYGMGKVLQAFVIVLMSIFSVMLYNAVDNIDLIEKFLSSESVKHTTGSEIRIDVNPKIMKTLTKMVYTMEGDRVSIIEMHNGKENPTNLPFIYCDMTYEETRDRVQYISEEYENMNMSKFTFPSYVYEHRFFIGSVEEMMAIDKKLAMRLDMNNVNYVGIIIIRTTVDIGFLMISYENVPNLSRDEIYASLSYYVQEIGTYLDYGKQIELKEKRVW